MKTLDREIVKKTCNRYTTAVEMNKLQLYISTWLNLKHNVKWRKDIMEKYIQYTIYVKSKNIPNNFGHWAIII